jgi:hypothetical protein
MGAKRPLNTPTLHGMYDKCTNNHILELLKIVNAFFIEELTKLVYNAYGRRFDCNAVRLSRYNNCPKITHFSIEYNTFLTLTSKKRVSLV